MVHGSEAPADGGSTAPTGEFGITLKGWRSQLRWAMTQREEDPSRVWLEIISIDERSKRALAGATDPAQLEELAKFRAKLDASIASLTEDLGDDNVAPLYSWLDLVRQRRRFQARIAEARAAVVQARALRLPDGAKAPKTDEQAAAQLTQAQGELEQWKTATPPEPPPEVKAIWDADGGDALRERMPREAMAVGRRGDEARKILEPAKGRTPGKHPWHGSKRELISIPVSGGMALVSATLAVTMNSPALGWLAGALLLTCGSLLTWSLIVRRKEKAELAAAIDWVWHALMYEERTRFADLEAGWLRALVHAQRGLKAFDAGPATGGQLRDFEQERPDLRDMIHEVARDTDDPPASAPPPAPAEQPRAGARP